MWRPTTGCGFATRSPMYAANVDGTVAVIEAAQAAGVRRTVYCSSVATLGFGYDRRAVNEDTPVDEAQMIGHYKRSKYLAERRAVELAAKGAEVVIVNPSTPIGEQDIKPTPTGRIVLDFLLGNFPAYMETGMNLVDVHDVARGHLLAFEKGRRGERYILGGENLTLKQILDMLAELTGLPSPRMKVPHSVAMAFAAFDQTFNGYLRNREPRATIEEVRMGKKFMWVDSAKAERELGYRHGPVREALDRAARWFVAQGYAPASKQRARAYERPGCGVRLCGRPGAGGWPPWCGAGRRPPRALGTSERKIFYNYRQQAALICGGTGEGRAYIASQGVH